MRLAIPKDAKAGSTLIPKGDYWISLHQEVQMIFLSAGGKDFRIPASKRSNKSKYKTVTVLFSPAGGVFWSIMVATPKYGEWIALIELGVGKEKDEKRRR